MLEFEYFFFFFIFVFEKIKKSSLCFCADDEDCPAVLEICGGYRRGQTIEQACQLVEMVHKINITSCFTPKQLRSKINPLHEGMVLFNELPQGDVCD